MPHVVQIRQCAIARELVALFKVDDSLKIGVHDLSLVQVHRSDVWDSLLDQPDLLVLYELRQEWPAILVRLRRVTQIELIQVLVVQSCKLGQAQLHAKDLCKAWHSPRVLYLPIIFIVELD